MRQQALRIDREKLHEFWREEMRRSRRRQVALCAGIFIVPFGGLILFLWWLAKGMAGK